MICCKETTLKTQSKQSKVKKKKSERTCPAGTCPWQVADDDDLLRGGEEFDDFMDLKNELRRQTGVVIGVVLELAAIE